LIGHSSGRPPPPIFRAQTIHLAGTAALLASVAWQPASSMNQDANSDAEAAMIALLNHTAEKYDHSTRVCVDTTLRQPRWISYPVNHKPDANRGAGWYSPEDSGDRTLSPELGAKLANAFSARPVTPSTLRTVDVRWMKTPLQSSTTPECIAAASARTGQRWLLKLSVPVKSGQFYFIEVNRICTPMCGSGWLYTLSKKRGRWQVIAMKGSWIS
jgi:hypothetical protein